MMSISFESEEIILEKLRKLRSMTDEELIKFGKDVRRLAENPFQRQLEDQAGMEAQAWPPHTESIGTNGRRFLVTRLTRSR
jgi:hypothetical protein